MEGIGAAVDSLLPDTPTQLLGTTSADNSPLDNFSWSWQCDGQNDHDGGVVVVYLAPSVNFQCVFKHSCEGGDGSTTLLGRAAVARTAEVTKFEEDQRTIGRLERPRGYEAVLAQRTIDRPTPKAPSTCRARSRPFATRAAASGRRPKCTTSGRAGVSRSTTSPPSSRGAPTASTASTSCRHLRASRCW